MPPHPIWQHTSHHLGSPSRPLLQFKKKEGKGVEHERRRNGGMEPSKTRGRRALTEASITSQSVSHFSQPQVCGSPSRGGPHSSPWSYAMLGLARIHSSKHTRLLVPSFSFQHPDSQYRSCHTSR